MSASRSSSRASSPAVVERTGGIRDDRARLGALVAQTNLLVALTDDLAVGGGGHGAHNNGNGPGHVGKEMKVAVQTGTPNSDGGLSKEQILKVVQSHAAAIQFCYEKELQRFPHLAGKVVIDWKVNLDGRVEANKIGSSSLGNPSAESCMSRQVKNWQFPKPNGVICNVSFPFFFKGQ